MTETRAEKRQQIPESFEQVMTHSGFGRHIGPYYVAELENDEGTLQHWTALKIDERHGGRDAGEYGHGGILLALLDEVMGRSASRSAGKTCVTVSMQTNFCAAMKKGDFLRATATVSRCGKSLVFVDAIAKCGDVLIGTATGVWMNSGKPLP